MAAGWSVTIVDYNGETSTSHVHTGNVTAVSLPGLLTDIADLRTAISGLIVGNQRSDKLTAYNTTLNPALPTSTDAQVERKWLVTYTDTLPFFDDPVNAIPNAGYGKIFTMEIATADSTLLENNSEFLDLDSAGPGQDFADAFETIARSPYGGTVTVQSIQLVGRTR
jgi:hypothetical protein